MVIVRRVGICGSVCVCVCVCVLKEDGSDFLGQGLSALVAGTLIAGINRTRTMLSTLGMDVMVRH